MFVAYKKPERTVVLPDDSYVFRFMDLSMKKIIHIDADCFYAAVEMRENPTLRDVPLAVGGDPGRRGVISTCNYIARQYGVRSAMASAYAKRLCPSLQILKPNFELYRAVSSSMHDIFSDYTDLVEPLSLDEAYLDVTDSSFCQGSATLMAQEIRERISRELGISVSAGVAPVKFLAKVASEWRKPNGLFTIAPSMVSSFSSQLSLSCIPGVGKVTQDKLARFGLHYCRDVAAFDEELLIKHFGSFARSLIQMCHGIDNREVSPRSCRKSISLEHTYPEDLSTSEQIVGCLPGLLEGLRRRLGRLDTSYGIHKKFVKLKFDNFVQTTREMLIAQTSDPFSESDFRRLLQLSWQREKRAVRLIGVGFRLNQVKNIPEQLDLPFPLLVPSTVDFE